MSCRATVLNPSCSIKWKTKKGSRFKKFARDKRQGERQRETRDHKVERIFQGTFHLPQVSPPIYMPVCNLQIRWLSRGRFDHDLVHVCPTWTEESKDITTARDIDWLHILNPWRLEGALGIPCTNQNGHGDLQTNQEQILTISNYGDKIPASQQLFLCPDAEGETVTAPTEV